MRSRLQTFAAFANSLLPIELDILQSVQRFEDTERSRILDTISANCSRIDSFLPYDEEIDKRKYSHLKTWIEERLEAFDVDKEFAWLSAVELSVHSDAIHSDDEKRLLRMFQGADATSYNFLKLYDLGRMFRHYLHVRMRYAEHKCVTDFLAVHRTSYEYARLVNDKLHQATEDIIAQYTTNSTDSMRWEQWLSAVFYDQSLDGYNRNLALIRLIFIAYNYRRFDLLPDKFDYQEKLLREGKFYSRRLLLNFYSQRLLMYARQNELEKATYYGYLSIRAENNDYVYYVNNLAAILLRQSRADEALKVLRQSLPLARKEQNIHNKIGNAAYICLAYNQLGQFKQSATHARTFFDVYRKEIFDHRWHLFFSAWLEALLGSGDFNAMLRLAQQQQLTDRNTVYQKSPNYLPSIPWMLALAGYRLEKLKFRQISQQFYDDVLQLYHQHGSSLPASMGTLFGSVRRHAPEVFDELKGLLQKRGIMGGY